MQRSVTDTGRSTSPADRKVKPVIDRRFPLAEVVEALRYVDRGQARGKVIVTV